jgi:hypothetical protein
MQLLQVAPRVAHWPVDRVCRPVQALQALQALPGCSHHHGPALRSLDDHLLQWLDHYRGKTPWANQEEEWKINNTYKQRDDIVCMATHVKALPTIEAALQQAQWSPYEDNGGCVVLSAFTFIILL